MSLVVTVEDLGQSKEIIGQMKQSELSTWSSSNNGGSQEQFMCKRRCVEFRKNQVIGVGIFYDNFPPGRGQYPSMPNDVVQILLHISS